MLGKSLNDDCSPIPGLRKFPSFDGLIALNYFPGVETYLYIYFYGDSLQPDGLGPHQYYIA